MMGVHYSVEVSRIVWGDYRPRLLDEVGSREDHLALLRQDAIERMRDRQRLRVYSFVVYENDGDSRSKVTEVVAYGDQESLEESVDLVWSKWVRERSART
jgi:hypothetical protein